MLFHLLSIKFHSCGGLLEILVFIGLFWANFKPKIEWVPHVFWGGSKNVTCSLPYSKSHGEDGSSNPLMSELELDVVFGFVEWTFKELNVDFLEMSHPTLKLYESFCEYISSQCTTLGWARRGTLSL